MYFFFTFCVFLSSVCAEAHVNAASYLTGVQPYSMRSRSRTLEAALTWAWIVTGCFVLIFSVYGPLLGFEAASMHFLINMWAAVSLLGNIWAH